jgi:hypothetical protein
MPLMVPFGWIELRGVRDQQSRDVDPEGVGQRLAELQDQAHDRDVLNTGNPANARW